MIKSWTVPTDYIDVLNLLYSERLKGMQGFNWLTCMNNYSMGHCDTECISIYNILHS